MRPYAEGRISQIASFLLESRQKIDHDINILHNDAEKTYNTTTEMEGTDLATLQKKKSILEKLKLNSLHRRGLEEQSSILTGHISRTLHDMIAARHNAFGVPNLIENEFEVDRRGEMCLLGSISRNIITHVPEDSCVKCQANPRNVLIAGKCTDWRIQQTKCHCSDRMHSWCFKCLYRYCVDEWCRVSDQELTLDDATCVVRCPDCSGAFCPYSMQFCMEPTEAVSTGEPPILPSDTLFSATKSMQDLLYEKLTSTHAELVTIRNYILNDKAGGPPPTKTSISVVPQSERKKAKRHCGHCHDSTQNLQGKGHYGRKCPYKDMSKVDARAAVQNRFTQNQLTLEDATGEQVISNTDLECELPGVMTWEWKSEEDESGNFEGAQNVRSFDSDATLLPGLFPTTHDHILEDDRRMENAEFLFSEDDEIY